jgi:hypothetical protein
MIGVPPHNCSICYQPYNNDRSPLILITCGHTFCKECLEMIFLPETKEIPCPECKQSTFILEAKALPKNRSLLDVIIFHEEKNRDKRNTLAGKINNKIDTSQDKKQKAVTIDSKNKSSSNEFQNQNFNFKTHSLLITYETILNGLEDTYIKILEEHSYLTEISDVLITKEVDEALDNLIDIINEYRNSLHNRIRNEFKKVNLIKDFKNSLDMYKKKLHVYGSKFIDIQEQNLDKEENLTKIKSYENNENLENKCDISDANYIEHSTELNNQERINLSNEEISISNNNDNEKDIISKVIPNTSQNPLESIKINLAPNHSFSQFELDNLHNEIKFAELYSLTLRHYSKEIYNPCKYFFINKFQIDKLSEDLTKLLQKICDFDENVYTYNLESLNSHDEKKIIKEISEACNQNNYRKIKFIFSHLRINPNFLYSDVLDQITYQTTGERENIFSFSNRKCILNFNFRGE